MVLSALRRMLDRRPAAAGASGGGCDGPAPVPPDQKPYQGYLNHLSTEHANGWVWRWGQDTPRAGFQIVLANGEIVAAGTADRPTPGLAGVGDGCHGFRARFARVLTPAERDSARLLVADDGQALPRAPGLRTDALIEGRLEELSAVHAHGWAWMRDWPEERLGFQVVLETTGEILAQGIAGEFKHGLSGKGIGDGAYGFWVHFDRPLDAAEHSSVVVRVGNRRHALPRERRLMTAYEPVLQVAMDIVDNCNLRCPFCLYDYEGVRTTHFMAPETLNAALRFLPYTRDGEFWFSCLHEPTLHPSLTHYIDRVPRELRRKLFFTTNLAKRMDESYFAWLAGNGMHHINVSIESRDPALYERMRKGARWQIFLENWNRLIATLDVADRPTPIRYIAMAYKSNLRELPDLVSYLLEHRRAKQVELRYSYNVPHMPPSFREAEFLDDADWTWLATALAGFSPDQLDLVRPPTLIPAPPTATNAEIQHAPAELLPGRALFRLSWDGRLKALGVRASSRYDAVQEETIFEGNINDIDLPEVFLRTIGVQ
jgi:sulfatase maturation enzyme AslB (radical SAM superfamily)